MGLLNLLMLTCCYVIFGVRLTEVLLICCVMG